MATFSELFKKYRLRSEFETLGDFAQEMQDRGLQYEESIYSHWQRGTRVPRDRNLVLIVTKIFIEHGGISTIREANTLLESVSQGYLTEKEIIKLPRKLLPQAPFQAPREIKNFTGRETFLQKAKENLLNSNSILISGCAGMGKTSCAINLAHSLIDDFPDGILWFRLDTSSPESILNAIGYTYGENISYIQNVGHKSSYIRSLLTNKRILLIYDNLEKNFPLGLLLPSSATNVVIVTSRYEDLADKFLLTKLPLSSFDPQESNNLQRSILGDQYVKKNEKVLKSLSSHLGHLPLAINLVSQELNKPYQKPEIFLKRLQSKRLELREFKYADQDLLSSLNIVFDSLETQSKTLFTSLGVFSGTDFALEAVAVINKLSNEETEKQLRKLNDASLVEYSTENRFRLHPIIKFFAQIKITDSKIYQDAAAYYFEFMKKTRLKNNYFKILQSETINIVYVFQKCVQLNYFQEICQLWTDLFYFLWDMGEWEHVERLAKFTYQLAHKHRAFNLKVICCIEGFGWVYYWTGKTNLAEKYIKKALDIGIKSNNRFIIAYAKQRLGRTLQGQQKFKESMSLLKESLLYFKGKKDFRRIGNNYRYLAETSSFMHNNKLAKTYIRNAFKSLRKLKDKFILTEMYVNLLSAHMGAILLLEGKFKEAEEHFKNGLDIDIKSDTKTVGLMWNHTGLGIIHAKKGDRMRASFHFNEAENLSHTLNLGKEVEKRHIFLTMLTREIAESQQFINQSIIK